MLVPLPAGPRSGGGRERLGQHRRRVAHRRPAARARAGRAGAGHRRRRRRARSACMPPRSRSRSGRSASSMWTPTRAAARPRRASAPRRRDRGPSGRADSRSPSTRAATPGSCMLALRSTAPDGICTSTAIYFGEPVADAAVRDVHEGHRPSRPGGSMPARRSRTCCELAAGGTASGPRRSPPASSLGRRARGARWSATG